MCVSTFNGYKRDRRQQQIQAMNSIKISRQWNTS